MSKPTVIVPHTRDVTLLRSILRDQGHEPWCVKLSGDHDYWQLLRDVWAAQETVVIVEHDILPHPCAIDELCACPGMWCSNSYRIDTGNGRCGIGLHHCLGCTKLSADLMRLIPNAFDEMPSRHWSKLDAQLCHIAMTAGQIPHPHRPPVIHLPKAA